MPTGFGKTHNVIDFIYNYYRDFAKQGRKVFFITSLKKNLPHRQLEKRFMEDDAEDDFDKHVIFINSNSETVIDNLLTVDSQIPERFKIKGYNDLRSYVETLKNNEGMDKGVKNFLRERIREELEPTFRRFVTKQLNHDFKTKAERLDAIKNKQEYRWIGDLYPAAFTDEKTIIFLSIYKFIRKNTPLVESSYYFHKRLIDDSLIFIDEFDATKENVLESIIESGLRPQLDLLDIFLNIHNHLMENECPGALLQESKQRKDMASKYNWPSLHDIVSNFQEKANQIFENYNLKHTCKLENESSSHQRSFLFYDYQFHQVLDSKKKRIEIVQDIENRTNWIRTSEWGEKGEGENIHSLIRGITGYLTYFMRGVGYLAKNYCQLKEEDERVEEIFPFDLAVKTVLNNFHLDPVIVEFLTENIVEKKIPYKLHNKTNAIQEQEFYDAGFSYYDIVDSDEHDTLSKIHMCSFSKTPESFLVEICSRAMVVGMSATAGLYTNIGNYDLEYLRSRIGSSFIRPSGTALERLSKTFSKRTQGYDQISIKTEFIGEEGVENDLKLLQLLMNDEEAANALLNEVNSKNQNEQGSDYIFSRYVRALRVWKYFVEHAEIRALLCFFNKFPKRSDSQFDLDIFYKYAEMIQGSSCSDSIVVLTSDNFDKKKPELLEALESGERRFIFSTYQTIGTGQNLQYNIPESTRPIKINEFSDHGKMDIDAIYLDRPTNLLININSDDLNEHDLVKYLFQLEFLVENGSISPNTFEDKLDGAFSRFVGRYRRKESLGDVIDLYQTDAYTRYVNLRVIQAIGRICRTNMKAPTIHVLADSFIQRHLTRVSLPDDVITVLEYTKLLESARGENKKQNGNERFENRASNRSNRSAAFIHDLLQNPWTDDEVELWQKLRERVLKQPSISSKEDYGRERYPIYVELPSPARSYRYSQKNDYRNIEVFFSAGKKSQEVSERAARLQELMAIGPLRELFVKKGWATTFNEGKLMLAPPIFNNIYKGALGEACGRFILEDRLKIPLLELDVDEYEKFDFKTENNDYIDFKLWNDNIAIPAGDMITKIQEKMDHCCADRVFVINILGSPGKFRPIVHSDEKIVEIPFICQNNALSEEALKFIMEEILK